jgi:hypothetical protein
MIKEAVWVGHAMVPWWRNAAAVGLRLPKPGPKFARKSTYYINALNCAAVLGMSFFALFCCVASGYIAKHAITVITTHL